MSSDKEGQANSVKQKNDASTPRKRHGAAAAADGPVETLTYRDPFAGVYKKYESTILTLTGIVKTNERQLDISSVQTENTYSAV
jgi:hypothetical protein